MDNSTPNMSELLVKYLDGELSGMEKEKVEQQLASDMALQQELDSLRATREAVKLYGLQQQVAGLHQQMMKEMRQPVQINTARRMLRISIAIAASVLLFIAGVMAYNFITLSPGKVFASHYRSYELGTMRDGNNSELSTIETAYKNKKFDEVVSITYDRPFTPRENFLRAMSYAEKDNDDKAIELYKQVITSNESSGTSIMKDEAEYYLALAFIRNNEYDNAQQLLEKIKSDPGHLYHRKVTRKLLRQLRMLKWRS